MDGKLRFAAGLFRDRVHTIPAPGNRLQKT
jgi:hypothetical protein